MDYTKAISSLLSKFQRKGVEIIKVYDGEEWIDCNGNSNLDSRKIAVEAVDSVEISHVRIRYMNEVANLVLITGNEPSEILADWGCKSEFVNLNNIIEEVSEEFYTQWEEV